MIEELEYWSNDLARWAKLKNIETGSSVIKVIGRISSVPNKIISLSNIAHTMLNIYFSKYFQQ